MNDNWCKKNKHTIQLNYWFAKLGLFVTEQANQQEMTRLYTLTEQKQPPRCTLGELKLASDKVEG